VRIVFGLPGAGQYEAVDALYQEPGIRYISTRHEQETSFMADGYARVSGDIAAVLVVPGPGLYNAAAGLATAHAVSSPVLIITGSRHASDGDSPEMSCMRPLTKWAARANRPDQIPTLVHEAVRQLKTGRPRPVALEIPPAVFAVVAEVESISAERYERFAADPEKIKRAATLLTAAERPVIWAGGGVIRSGAGEALQTITEYLQIPVVTTRQGKGAISSRHPLCLGLAERRYQPLRAWLSQRDLILAVGTSARFDQYKQHTIKIDIDEAEIGRADHIFGLVGDAKQSLEAIYRAISVATPARVGIADKVQAEVRAINAARFDPAVQLQPQWDLMQAVRAAMPDDGILVQGMNQMGYYSRNYYPVYKPGSYLTASSLATLGCAYPLALGAKLANPERAVVALSGDGGFLYNSQALATAVQYNINAVVIVFNDNAYGNVLRAQIEEFDGHVIGTRLHNPDFVKLAEVYGVRGVRANGAEQLEAALRQALAIEAPTLIEVPVGMMEREY
jgi:acetolactate synthase-1/2/3 large subunit